jgi:enoyl-CoA hydratase
MTKEVMWSQLEIGSMQAGIDLENRTQIMTSQTTDHLEAMQAFLEKRDPAFRFG